MPTKPKSYGRTGSHMAELLRSEHALASNLAVLVENPPESVELQNLLHAKHVGANWIAVFFVHLDKLISSS